MMYDVAAGNNFLSIELSTVVRNERLSARRAAIRHHCTIVEFVGPFSRLRAETYDHVE